MTTATRCRTCGFTHDEQDCPRWPARQPACPSGNADLAPHRECPACGRQQYLALSGHWTHCLAEADTCTRTY